MTAGIFKVCLVVVTTIINHPLLFPRESTTIPETEEETIRKMKEQYEKLQLEQLRLEEEMAKMTAEKTALEMATEAGGRPGEGQVAWDLWSTLCMILFLVIEVWRQDYQDGSSQEPLGEEEELTGLGNTFKEVTLPKKALLTNFYERCIRGASSDTARTREFVEGFVDDLLEALRSVCNRDADMEVEDFIGVGSMYENWRVEKPLLCDLYVVFAPPEPYRFYPEVWCTTKSIPPDRQGYGKIKVCRADEDPTGCICGKTKLGEDMLCLLHSKNNKTRPSRDMEDLLCFKDSSYLDTDQVMKWFQIALTKAWQRISRKYEFDLAFRHLDTPGALKIKFRSGKFIPFNIMPVVQCEDSDLYFVSHFPRGNPLAPPTSNTYWFLSFAVYERQFFKTIAKTLPENSCHLSCFQIVSFLHRKQGHLTGPSGLTNYHLKTVLFHLLLARPAGDWEAEKLEARVSDLLRFLEKSLLEKKLCHFFVGNRKIPVAVGIPEVFRKAEPVNLFRPFVLHRSLYRKTVDSFSEMLKNTSALISEYALHQPSEHTDLPRDPFGEKKEATPTSPSC
ncbi:inositol 1,4,5-trisphosphate receptor-interacting protein [Ornithorhynchus anatinus]|uniref:Inositol 1,4,5-trisphosphate receptor-interacting protein n=1 Tax=Ornithorhynchus anatinus TaxID=9258 RepID=F7ET78_ORNAN|nr:inositol 1,4,5-trisphosphate receptor-interacting protein [Ornithorhynchus anatinus]XP_028937061.1 inositol 1,4,5-trisphosphate receptor-interacting protein [Ornithorhynchus anatinus]